MKRALISVSDKNGVENFAKGLVQAGVEIISTGGTKKYLDELGVPTISIEEVTGFPEMLDGRVKTLHPLIHGGLLGKRQEASHIEAVKAHDIHWIDYVCVNLYPFKETISRENVSLGEAIEQIDIGGPSMLRSGAKNFESVTVVVDPADYQQILSEIKTNGETTYHTRQRLAAKVFRHTAAYDAIIANYLTESVEEVFPETYTVTYNKKEELRYGENGHQKAAFYEESLSPSFALSRSSQLHGKALSYNNIHDADAALRIINEFTEPAVVAVKHMNPCGVGTGKTILAAYNFAYKADPISIFGGIVALNREVDLATATEMSQLFLEIIIAPSFSVEALALLSQKKNLRLLTLDFTQTEEQPQQLELTSVMGGLLLQEGDNRREELGEWQVVTEGRPTSAEIKALEFNWQVVKHVKSNAIVIGNQQQTFGVGAGQMNRIGSVKIAIDQAETAGYDLSQSVMASDAFFPMADCVEFAAEHGIRAIIQPGGSIKDQLSIDKANELGIAMIFTGRRHFKH